MKYKIITFFTLFFTLMAGVASAKNKQSSQPFKKVDAAPVHQGKQYIHKPDSTMYHPGNGVKSSASKVKPATAGKQYIHKPDSTMYHPGNGVKSSASKIKPVKAAKGYRHAPDSTMVRPKTPKVPTRR